VSPFAQIIQSMQRQALDFEVLGIDENKNETVPGDRVLQAQVIDQCVIHDVYLREQVQLVASQIQHWERLAARAQRVFEMTERKYRIWREKTMLAAFESPTDPPPAKWKKPTVREAEAAYRVHPEYEAWGQRVERAREAWNACEANAKGFTAKRYMLEKTVRRSQADGAPILDV